MSYTETEIRNQIIHYARQLADKGLSPGKSGNLSVRFGNACLITPSATDYQQLKPEDIVLIDFSGKVIRGVLKPSSEWHFHCDIYKGHPDVQAVVHTHSTYGTALACAHKPIPAFHYMVAVAGGKDIPLAPYALFGTEELSGHVVHALEDRKACLLANHGVVSVGDELSQAVHLAEEVENLAFQYCEVLKIGKPRLLTDAEMALVLDKFSHYGERI